MKKEGEYVHCSPTGKGKNYVLTAPKRDTHLDRNEYFKLFLAGTIDNGVAEDWQSEVIAYFGDRNKTIQKPCILYNPRRRDWNPEPSEEEMENQIFWERDHLDLANMVLFNFVGTSTGSPITFLELGYYASWKSIVVVCPENFYRYTNIKLFCDNIGAIMFHTLEEALTYIKEAVNEPEGENQFIDNDHE